MINRLTSAAFFPLSGATLNADYQPQSGITAVVGENGSGKTYLSVETVRWLLFGKAALRGVADDYKEANATGEFTIRGARYTFSRGRHEWVKDASGSMIAKGATETTAKAVDLLGYDLDVFDLCNAATQGDVQRLGKLRPAERKAIIDKVARLTAAEATEKSCRDEAKGFKREVEALTKTLRAPGDAPQPPANYFPSAQARADLAQLRDVVAKADAIRSRMKTWVEPTNPNVPVYRVEAIAALAASEARRLAAEGERQRLNHVLQECRIFVANAKPESELIAAAERNVIRAAIEARGPAPQLTAAQSEANWAAWAIYDAYKPSEAITCPSCRHVFHVDGPPPAVPAWTKTALRDDDRQRQRHQGPALILPDGPDMTDREIAQHRESRAADARYAAARAALDALDIPEDKSAELATLRTNHARFEAYKEQLDLYETAQAANAVLQGQLDALGVVPTPDELTALYERLSEAERYEAECRAYDLANETFKDTSAKVRDAQHLADEYAAGAKDIATARATVKAMLAPKISHIATSLIRDMTMGKLKDLVLTDDMEIVVGGQRIETLSGAGVTVANIALRVAMGMALVGHVFPVFLADEIDGDMDAGRREATLQALVGLKKHLSQIILVTHRGAGVADHVWDVTG
jgi:DNA repair exonuclease SbcCD ATPase subunit